MAKLTPLKAIRAKCLDCTCYQPKEVRLCTITRCPLHEYRFGKRPTTTDNLDPESDDEENVELADDLDKNDDE